MSQSFSQEQFIEIISETYTDSTLSTRSSSVNMVEPSNTLSLEPSNTFTSELASPSWKPGPTYNSSSIEATNQSQKNCVPRSLSSNGQALSRTSVEGLSAKRFNYLPRAFRPRSGMKHLPKLPRDVWRVIINKLLDPVERTRQPQPKSTRRRSRRISTAGRAPETCLQRAIRLGQQRQVEQLENNPESTGECLAIAPCRILQSRLNQGETESVVRFSIHRRFNWNVYEPPSADDSFNDDSSSESECVIRNKRLGFDFYDWGYSESKLKRMRLIKQEEGLGQFPLGLRLNPQDLQSETYDPFQQGSESKPELLPNVETPQGGETEKEQSIILRQQNSEYFTNIRRYSNPSYKGSPQPKARDYQQKIQERIMRLSGKASKRSRMSEQLDKLEPFQISPSLRLPETTESSNPSQRVSKNSQQFRDQHQEEKEEYDMLIQEYNKSDLDRLLEECQQSERDQQRKQKEAFEKAQSEFNDNTNAHLTFLQQYIEDLHKHTNTINKKVYERLEGQSSAVNKIFRWHYKTQEDNLNFLRSQITKLQQGIQEQDEIQSSVQYALDQLFDHVEDQMSKPGPEILENKLVNIITSVISRVDLNRNTATQQMNRLSESFEKQLGMLEQDFNKKLNNFQTSSESSQVKALQQRMDGVNKNLNEIVKYLKTLEKMIKVSYFSSNMLVEQDSHIKKGLQESGSRQAQMLDLITRTNDLILRNIHNPSEQQQAAREFQDSVRSLNLNRKIELNVPQIGKIPEYLQSNVDEYSEREQMEAKAYDPNRRQFEEEKQAFRQKFPNQSIQMTVLHSLDQLQKQIEEYNTQNTTESPPQILKRPDVKSEVKEEQTATSEPTFDFRRTLRDSQPYNPRDALIVPQMEQQARNYAKFQFKNKYNRNIHPRIFMLQFETVANQYSLTPEQKSLQFMFTLEGEYLDWYKARSAKHGYSYPFEDLKREFYETFTKKDDDARDDLYRIYQRNGESPQQFLYRLRDSIQTSNLTDDDVKKQFYSGLKSVQAKQYIYNMRQFNEKLYSRHTTTTLMQELEKQSERFNYQLTVTSSRPDKNISSKSRSNNKDRTNQKPYKNYQPRSQQPTKPQNYSNPQYKQQDKKQNVNKKQANVVEQALTPQKSQTSSSSSDSEVVDDQYQYSPTQPLDDTSNESSEDQEEQQTAVVTSAFCSANTQTETEQSHSTPKIEAGEGEQVHSIFRKNQKNASHYKEKLDELAQKGRELPFTSYKNYKSLQYATIPEKQMLVESPTQFISACQYIQKCLYHNSNLLKNEHTVRWYNKFMDSISVRFADIGGQDGKVSIADGSDSQGGDEQPIPVKVNTTIQIPDIDYLYYINIKFQDKDVKALIDTGSSVTIVSEKFCKKHNLQFPQQMKKKQVILADGSITYMHEWKNAEIQINQYMTIIGSVLISSSTSYDLLFGLNACQALNVNIYPDCMRYAVDVNGKERFGRVDVQRVKIQTQTKQ